MYYAVYLNPTIDRTLYLDSLNIGGTNRPFKTVVDGAGKAVNVAVVLKELGEDVCVLGFEYGDGSIIANRLSACGISYDFIKCSGNSRINTKIFDDGRKQITEINESGAYPGDAFMEMMSDKVLGLPRNGDTVIFTGSLPPGADTGIYAGWISELKKRGIRCVLDASGDVLLKGVKASPFLIKPNIDEISCISDLCDDICLLLHKCRDMYSIDIIALSLGADGAYYYDGKLYLFAPSVNVDVKSTVGAGDSMLAGILHGLNTGSLEALKCGVAAATASVMLEGTQLMCRNDFNKIYNRVSVEIIKK